MARSDLSPTSPSPPNGIPGWVSQTTYNTVVDSLNGNARDVPRPNSIQLTHPIIRHIWQVGFPAEDSRGGEPWTRDETTFWEAAENAGWTHGLSRLYLGRTHQAVRLRRSHKIHRDGPYVVQQPASAGQQLGTTSSQIAQAVQQAVPQQPVFQQAITTTISSPASTTEDEKIEDGYFLLNFYYSSLFGRPISQEELEILAPRRKLINLPKVRWSLRESF